MNNIFRARLNSKGLNLGKPEAEAENASLLSYFEDYFDVEDGIDNGYFIISGRKGAGKSAYAVWLMQKSKHNENLNCSIIKKSEFDLEEIINNIKVDNIKFEVFFEWIILVRMVKMIIESNIGNYLNQVKALNKFYKSNAGYVDVDKYTISEILNNTEVNFAPLKSYFGFFNRFFGAKLIKAPFYKMITPLRNVVIEVLKMEIFADIKFYVLFDDLDVKLKLTREKDCIMLLDLIRVARRYNTEYMTDTSAKVLIFLRDDVGDRLSGADADKNKIFSSYEQCINWYEHDKAIVDENQILLRKFINRRISIAFEKNGYDYNRKDPWLSFVEETNEGATTSFKYILDHTFYLPRDFLTIFKNVSQKRMLLPLSHTDVNSLLREYAPVKKKEIEDELYTIYDKEKVKTIFMLLEEIGKDGKVSYTSLLSMFEEYNLEVEDFQILIDYSLVVPIDENGYCYFNYRESEVTKDYDNYSYGIPRFLRVYYKFL